MYSENPKKTLEKCSFKAAVLKWFIGLCFNIVYKIVLNKMYSSPRLAADTAL